MTGDVVGMIVGVLIFGVIIGFRLGLLWCSADVRRAKRQARRRSF